MSPNSPLSPSDADDDARRADALLRVLGRRRDILVAVGIVMTTDDVDADEALATLEALARRKRYRRRRAGGVPQSLPVGSRPVSGGTRHMMWKSATSRDREC